MNEGPGPVVMVDLARARELAIRWQWTRLYERLEQARREGRLVMQPLKDPLEEPAIGTDDHGRVELRAWVSAWLDEYVESSTKTLRELLTASQFSTYLETKIETRERGNIIYSLAFELHITDTASESRFSQALALLQEAAPLRFGPREAA